MYVSTVRQSEQQQRFYTQGRPLWHTEFFAQTYDIAQDSSVLTELFCFAITQHYVNLSLGCIGFPLGETGGRMQSVTPTYHCHYTV